MRKMKNTKGFTLIELLAVIVILGVIMAIAIPSMTGYIANSKKDSLLNSAQQMLSGAKDMLTSENAYPGPLTALVIPISKLELDKGGISPYDNKPFNEASQQSYILVYNSAESGAEVTSSSYQYYIGLTDNSGNCLELVSENLLASAKTKSKRGLVKGGTCTIAPGTESAGSKTFTVYASGVSNPTPITPNSVSVYTD